MHIHTHTRSNQTVACATLWYYFASEHGDVIWFGALQEVDTQCVVRGLTRPVPANTRMQDNKSRCTRELVHGTDNKDPTAFYKTKPNQNNIVVVDASNAQQCAVVCTWT